MVYLGPGGTPWRTSWCTDSSCSGSSSGMSSTISRFPKFGENSMEITLIKKRYSWMDSVVNPGTKLWRPPVEVSQFWRQRSGFGARFRFCKPNKNNFISMKPKSNLNHFHQLLFHTFPPPLDQYNLFWSYKKRAPKPLLGCQNWVTSTFLCGNWPVKMEGAKIGCSIVILMC